ncbi:MAG: glycosyltransferase family 39 protein [Chloroflexi bacterium]|nr:glycosyltransferase family 39 protein [Chloroflexota bacterium]
MRQREPRPRQLLHTAATFLDRLLPTRSWRNATFWLIILLNLSLIILYFWSRGGASMIVRIEATDSQYTAFVDGRQVAQGTFRSASEGGVGLLLSRHYRLPALPAPNGVDWIRVTDYDTGETIFEDDFNGPPDELWENERGRWRTEDGVFTTNSGDIMTTGFQPWSNVIVEAKLRNVTEATLFVHVQDANNAVVLGVGQFRAFGGATLGRLEDRIAVERIDIARLEVDRGQTLQSITAMLLRPYPVALLLFAGIVILAFVVRFQRLEKFLQVAARFVPDMATGIIVGLAAGTGVLLWYLLYVVGDAMPHVPDSVLYVFQSNIFASFNVTANAPPAQESFSIFHPHMLQVVEDRWFTHYPFGHPLFLAAGQLVNAVWLVPPLLGALSVAMIYWLGKRLYGVSVGLIAAALLFSSPFFLMQSSNFMSHNTAVFTIMACLVLITLPTRWRLPAMFFAGVSIGLLFNIRPLTAVAFLPVLAGFMVYEIFRAGPVSVPSKPWLLVAGVGTILVAAAVAVYVKGLPDLIPVGGIGNSLQALLVSSPLAIPAAFLGYKLFRDRTGRGDHFREDLAFAGGSLLLLGAYFLYNQLSTGSAGTNAYELQGTYTENFVGFSGTHSLSLGLQNQQELLSLMLLVANGWPLAVGLIIAALPFLLGSRNKWDYFLGASFVAIATSPIVYGSSAIMHGPRFWYESLPFLILLTARGAQYLASSAANTADWLAGRVRKGPSMTSQGLAGLVTYTIIAGLIAFSIYSWMFGQREAWGDEQIGVDVFTPQSASELEGFNFTDDRLLQEADQLDLKNALVFVNNCAQWWCYGSVFWTNSPDLDGDIVWAERQETEDDLTLLDAFPNRIVYIAEFAPLSIKETTREEITLSVEERLAEDPTLVPTSVTTTPEERDEIRKTEMEEIQAVLAQYAQQNGSYPNTDNQVQSLCAYTSLDVGCDLKSVGPIPVDPLGEPIQNGYWYRSDGRSYTLIALRETELGAPSMCPEGLYTSEVEQKRTCVGGSLP